MMSSAPPSTLLMASTPMTEPRKVFIETLGCQMNKADSELMLGLLQREGFTPTEDSEVADLLIINTCQIRENAEEKAYSYLNPWGKLKQRRPHVKLAMAGCVAQQAKGDVFNRAPYVDMVFGTQNIHELPKL
jgi:tRNA-2-methylthio-N6-dimethylallyladenosine synthase